MAHVIPPLPSGARKSDYVPLDKLLRVPKHCVVAKNKAPIGDNTSSSALVAALQGAFENNSIGAGSTKTAADPKVAGGNSTAGHLDAFTHDPPDQPQPQASRQVCPSSRAILLSACVYALIVTSLPDLPAGGPPISTTTMPNRCLCYLWPVSIPVVPENPDSCRLALSS
jgi:hypothetical protein